MFNRSSSGMCNSEMLKKEFLKKWMKGLHVYNGSNAGNASILERKRAIKLSADVAMASTRNAGAHWRQALMDDVVSSTYGTNKIQMVEEMLGRKVSERNYRSAKAVSSGLIVTCSRRILRRSHFLVSARRKAKRAVPPRASSIARNIVKSKKRVLKSLVPGGEKMDERCLIRETLDYIVSLQLQVDVMRFLANAADQGLEPCDT